MAIKKNVFSMAVFYLPEELDVTKDLKSLKL